MPRLATARTLTFASIVALTLALSSHAADWPQFLGPNRDGSTPEKLRPWGAGPGEVWKARVGEAHSSPVVAGGVVYAFYKQPGRHADSLAAFDPATGDRKWENFYPREAFAPPFGLGPRSTPTVSGGKVYTFGNTGVLARWDAQTGKLEWQVDTLKQFSAPNLTFGVSASPLVIHDKVIVPVGGKGAGVVAFESETGAVAWQATDDPASYASPILVGSGDSAQVVLLTGSHVRGLSLSGRELWAVEFKDKLNESSTTPVVVGDVLIASSVTAGSIGLKLAMKDGAPTATELWRDEKLTCYFSTPIAVGPHVYMVTGAATLTDPMCHLYCVEAESGKVLWTRERVGRYHAALLLAADGRALLFDDSGQVTAFRPDPTGFRLQGRAKVCGPTWAHPAYSDGRLYVRDDRNLYAIEFGGK